MAFFATLKIDAIQGESVVDTHEDEIDVIGWSWGAAQVGTGHVGTGGGAGKVDVEDLVIHKKVDKASPNLFLACVTGKHIPKVTLTIRKAGGDKALDYYVIAMEKVFITGFDNDVAYGDDEIGETLRLKFRMVEVKYQPQDGDSGTAKGGSIDAKYDIAKVS